MTDKQKLEDAKHQRETAYYAKCLWFALRTGPFDNKMVVCPFCGRQIEEA